MHNYTMPDADLRGNSTAWANWMAVFSLTTCEECFSKHGTVYPISILENREWLPVLNHLFCRCRYVPMRTKPIGQVTNAGFCGADVFLYYLHKLPNSYIGKSMARKLGWKDKKGNLSDVLPGKMIGGDIYYNTDEKLPSATGRVWYEADINYTAGYRNDQRIIYSNDGLIFATYDHFSTFYQVIK